MNSEEKNESWENSGLLAERVHIEKHDYSCLKEQIMATEVILESRSGEDINVKRVSGIVQDFMQKQNEDIPRSRACSLVSSHFFIVTLS